MDRPNWIRSLESGIGYIDSEHRLFYEITNRAVSDYRSHSRDSVIKTYGPVMICYSLSHVMDEEHVMRYYGFPGLEEHIHAHEVFKKNLFSIICGTVKSDMKFIEFLMNTWYEHILREDYKYITFVKTTFYL